MFDFVVLFCIKKCYHFNFTIFLDYINILSRISLDVLKFSIALLVYIFVELLANIFSFHQNYSAERDLIEKFSR